MTREKKLEEMLEKLLTMVEQSEALDYLLTNPDSDWSKACEEANKILNEKSR